MPAVTDVTADMTIDELARETGMTVRNIRAHQSRGLLPPPEVRARTGYYGSEHVARLRLIQELQANGYNLAAIKHLLDRSDGSAEDTLGFARTLLAPFENEQPEVVEPGRARRAVRDRRGGRRQAPRPRRAARADRRRSAAGATRSRARRSCGPARRCVELGVPVDKALDIVERITKNADSVSSTFVQLFMSQVWKPFDAAGRPEAEWPEVREALERLRPLMTETLRRGLPPAPHPGRGAGVRARAGEAGAWLTARARRSRPRPAPPGRHRRQRVLGHRLRCTAGRRG